MRSKEDLEDKLKAVEDFQKMLDDDDEIQDLLGGIQMGLVYAMSEGEDDLPV